MIATRCTPYRLTDCDGFAVAPTHLPSCCHVVHGSRSADTPARLALWRGVGRVTRFRAFLDIRRRLAALRRLRHPRVGRAWLRAAGRAGGACGNKHTRSERWETVAGCNSQVGSSAWRKLSCTRAVVGSRYSMPLEGCRLGPGRRRTRLCLMCSSWCTELSAAVTPAGLCCCMQEADTAEHKSPGGRRILYPSIPPS
jgi:hypothetical protein